MLNKYSIKLGLEEALNQIVRLGSYVPVQYSDWAMAIDPVLKEDVTVRIYGDYKMMINSQAKCYYSVPYMKSILVTLNEGEKFTKLNLSNTYQQLKLDRHHKKCSIYCCDSS